MHLKLAAQQEYVKYYDAFLNVTSLFETDFIFLSLINYLKPNFTAIAHVELP